MKKWMIIIIIIAIIILIGILLLFLRGNEDDWIKDSKGMWIKHGNPAKTPKNVIEQQDAISCGTELYNQVKANEIEFNSQCLGKCSDYSIDVVNVPRNADDDKEENQCSDFRNGVTNKFIELDKEGEIVRVF